MPSAFFVHNTKNRCLVILAMAELRPVNQVQVG